MKLKLTNKQGVELLHFIFERELKPPFQFEKHEFHNGVRLCNNKDDEVIGSLESNSDFNLNYYPFVFDIGDKVCEVFRFSCHTDEWWATIYPFMKSWLEDQLQVKLQDVLRV